MKTILAGLAALLATQSAWAILDETSDEFQEALAKSRMPIVEVDSCRMNPQVCSSWSFTYPQYGTNLKACDRIRMCYSQEPQKVHGGTPVCGLSLSSATVERVTLFGANAEAACPQYLLETQHSR